MSSATVVPRKPEAALKQLDLQRKSKRTEGFSPDPKKDGLYFFSDTTKPTHPSKKRVGGPTEPTDSKGSQFVSGTEGKLKVLAGVSETAAETVDLQILKKRKTVESSLGGTHSFIKTRIFEKAGAKSQNLHLSSSGVHLGDPASHPRRQEQDVYSKQSFTSTGSVAKLAPPSELRPQKRSVPNLLISSKVGITAKSKSKPVNYGVDLQGALLKQKIDNLQEDLEQKAESFPNLKLKMREVCNDPDKLGSLERVVTHMCNSKYLDELDKREQMNSADVFLTAAPLGVSSAHQLRRLVDNRRLVHFGAEQAESKVSVSKKMNAPRVMERWMSSKMHPIVQPQSFLRDLSTDEKGKAHIYESLRLLGAKNNTQPNAGKSTGGFSALAHHRIVQTSSTKHINSPKIYNSTKLKTEISQRTIDMYKGTKDLISIREVDHTSPSGRNQQGLRMVGSMSPKLMQIRASPRARRMLDSPKASREFSKETSCRSKDQLKALHDPSYFKYTNTVEQRQQRNLMTIRLNATATLLKKMYQQYRVEGQQMLAHLNEEEIRKHARKMEKVLRERRFKDRDLACTQFGQAIHEQNQKLEEMIQFLHDKYKPASGEDWGAGSSPQQRKQKRKLERGATPEGFEDELEEDLSSEMAESNYTPGTFVDSQDGQPKRSLNQAENSFFKSGAEEEIAPIGGTNSLTGSRDTEK